MRIWFARFLLLFYLLLSGGLSLHFHYCKDNLRSVSVFLPEEHCCSGEASDECGFHSNCCRTDSYRIALEEEHIVIPVVNAKLTHIPASSAQPVISKSKEVAMHRVPDCYDGPARAPDVPAFIEFCRLTYYG